MNGAARITLYDPKRSSPHSLGPEGLILGTPPHTHTPIPRRATHPSQQQQQQQGQRGQPGGHLGGDVSLDLRSQPASGLASRRGGAHPRARPHSIPGAFPRHLLPGSSLCFVFPKTASLSRHRLAQPPPPFPQPPPRPGSLSICSILRVLL